MTLQEYNNERLESHKESNFEYPILKGVECPYCGKEELMSADSFVYSNYPPQYKMRCKLCLRECFRY